AAFIYPVFLGCPIIKMDLSTAGSFPISFIVNMHNKLLDNLSDDIDDNTKSKLSTELKNTLVSKGIPSEIRKSSLRKSYRIGAL
ncbi:MAG: hypothetical protein WAM11_04290, partial [Cyanobium sp.]